MVCDQQVEEPLRLMCSAFGFKGEILFLLHDFVCELCAKSRLLQPAGTENQLGGGSEGPVWARGLPRGDVSPTACPAKSCASARGGPRSGPGRKAPAGRPCAGEALGFPPRTNKSEHPHLHAQECQHIILRPY